MVRHNYLSGYLNIVLVFAKRSILCCHTMVDGAKF